VIYNFAEWRKAARTLLASHTPPEEVDLIAIVVDADDVLIQRQQALERALKTIRSNHLDENELPINDQSAGGLAIRNFETWLLADFETLSKVLGEEIEQITDLENVEISKNILEDVITKSTYLAEDTSNQRPLKIRWKLAFEIDLAMIKSSCPIGYVAFINNLTTVAKLIESAHLKS